MSAIDQDLAASVKGRELTSIRAIFILGLALAASTPTVADAAAAQGHKAHHARPADQDDALDITATIPQEKVLPAPADDPETLPTPFHLPNASRARMHECGLKWEAVKMSGGAGDETWREFGTRCLSETSAANGPSFH